MGSVEFAGQAKIRPQADGFRWSDQACFPQEGKSYEIYLIFILSLSLWFGFHLIFSTGQDHQEDYFEVGVQGVQDQEAVVHKANQALRAWREEEDYWRLLNFASAKCPLLLFYMPWFSLVFCRRNEIK